MMKSTYVLLTALFSVSLFGQNVITNAITSQHQEIRGSKIKMIPPKDFTTATNFMGFQQQDTNSSIMVLDVSASFDLFAKGLTKETLAKQGVTVEYIESITLNNHPALLIKGEQFIYETHFTKYILTFGTESETIVINGVSPNYDKKWSESIINALLTTVYDTFKILSPLDAVDFKIDTTDTDFSFSKSRSNVMIYEKKEALSPEHYDYATFVAAKTISKSNVLDQRNYALNRIQGLPMQVHKINTTHEVITNGVKGYEITAEGVNRKTGQRENVYFVILFNNLDSYLLYGISSQNTALNNASFKKLAESFKLKSN